MMARVFLRRLLLIVAGTALSGSFFARNVEGQTFQTPAIHSIFLPKTGIAERLQTVHSLGTALSHDEIEALYSFLKLPPAPDEKNIAGLHVLKNDILVALRRQKASPVGLPDLLIEIYRNPKQDSVTRDYAIQHLALLHDELSSDDPEQKQKVHAVLQEALREKTSIAGTALLGLHRLSTDKTVSDSNTIKDLALDWALSSQTKPEVRIAALQVCAECGVKEVLPMAESLAQASGHLPLRLSAIAALGQLGGEKQTALLKQLVSEQNDPVQAAIRAALRHLQQNPELF